MTSYVINPFTGNLDRAGVGGGGGGDVTINFPDGPPLTGNVFNFLAQEAGNSPVTRLRSEGGDAIFENSAWETQYVVDKSVEPGLRGTYSTIQAAIDQAALDGMSFSSAKKIIIRPSDTPYVENLNILPGVILYAAGSSLSTLGFAVPVIIEGNHTFPSIGYLTTCGIVWTCSSGVMFAGGGGTNALSAEDCIFKNNTPGGLIGEFSTGISYIKLFNCSINAGLPLYAFDVGFLGYSDISNCNFNGSGFRKGAGQLRMNYCSNVGRIEQTQATNGIIIKSCQLNTSGAPNIFGLGSAIISESTFSNDNQYCISLEGGCDLNNSTGTSNSSGLGFVDPAMFLFSGYSQSGNVLLGPTISTDFFASSKQGYIGINDTTSPRQVEIYPGYTGYHICICDESGNANVNAITIISGGGGLINGLPSYIINESYGSVFLRFDGVDWVATSTSNAASAPLVSSVDEADAISLTSAVNSDITSIELTKGRWSISAVIQMSGNPTVSGPQQISVSTVSETHGILGDTSLQTGWLTANFALGGLPLSIPANILNLSADTTVYLVSSAEFSGGVMNVFGRINAVRVG